MIQAHEIPGRAPYMVRAVQALQLYIQPEAYRPGWTIMPQPGEALIKEWSNKPTHETLTCTKQAMRKLSSS